MTQDFNKLEEHQLTKGVMTRLRFNFHVHFSKELLETERGGAAGGGAAAPPRRASTGGIRPPGS